MKRLILLSLIVISGISCQDELSENSNKPTTSIVKKDHNLLLKKKFGKALAMTLADSKNAREIIKNEALKKFNHDYDVLYKRIKNTMLPDGNTLHGLLTNHLSPEELMQIERQIPTLTIFVPKLPEDCFSAENWNTETEIPEVGIRSYETDGVCMFDSDGKERLFDYGVPAFPVVVVKENERVVYRKNNDNSLRSHPINEDEFNFIDDSFDNDNPELRSGRDPVGKPKEGYHGTGTAKDPYIDKFWDLSFEAYDNYTGINGWQRDYVYYGITPTNTIGAFKNDRMEYITGMEMVGDPQAALRKISDQADDPSIYKEPTGTYGSVKPKIEWTEGNFEFKVKIYIGAKNGIGNELFKYFTLTPDQLFTAKWKLVQIPGSTQKNYLYEGLEFKRADLNVALFDWNLENYGTSVRISLEEIDPSQTIQSSTNTSVEFATNFNFEASLGEVVKLGMKFGASAKYTTNVGYVVTTSIGNDELGDVIINFYDDIITNRDMELKSKSGERVSEYYSLPAGLNKRYNSGWYRLYIAPKR